MPLEQITDEVSCSLGAVRHGTAHRLRAIGNLITPLVDDVVNARACCRSYDNANRPTDRRTNCEPRGEARGAGNKGFSRSLS
jgi:hypothetical protein